MNDPVVVLLAALAYLQVKHFICDYPLQSLYQLRNKGTYLHPGGILHAGLHALLTIPVFLIARPSLSLALFIVAGEFLVHYHIDWSKEQVLRRWRWTQTDRRFWWAMGLDQFAHQLTYLVMGGLLVLVR